MTAAGPLSHTRAHARWASARPLYDIALAFESVDEPDARMRHALEILKQLVSYDCCALLEAQPGHEHRVLRAPSPSGEDVALTTALEQLFGLLSERHEAPAVNPAARAVDPRWSAHLAVPLVGVDQVIGLLFVGRAGEPYGEEELSLLSVVAAQIAAYLTTLRLNREKDEFLAMLSHELRTPLTAVLGWAALLRAGKLGEAARARALDSITQNAGAMSKLIEDLLDVSRAATGKLSLDLQPTDVAQVVEAAVEAAQPLARRKSIRMTIVRDRDGQVILGDAARLQQVVSNLVTNALKFTPSGGAVQVDLDHTPHHVRIRVSDTGIGIGPELLPQIFDRFRQADPSSRRGQDGLGLGLAITRDIVELHGGSVHAESTGVGAGAIFTVLLPLSRAAASRIPSPAPDMSIGARPLAGVRVLVAEDDSDAREVIATMLELHGATVTAVASAAEAHEVIGRARPDVLVCDIAMPGEDGYQLMREELSREPQGETQLPAIALTGHTSEEDRARALAAGFCEHLAKPIDPVTLVSIVARLAGPR